MKQNMERRMKRIFVLALLFALFALPARAQGPTDTLKVGLDQLMVVLRDPQYNTEAGLTTDHLAALREVVYDFFDFEELTRRAVGKTWNTFTPEQREGLTAALKDLLEKTYIRKLNTEFLQELESFQSESVKYLGEKIKGRLAMVNANLVLPDKEIAVDFKLINKQEKWWVYDIIGEGLTLLGIYRDEFRNALLNQSPDDLIDSLRQRVIDIEAGREDAKAQ